MKYIQSRYSGKHDELELYPLGDLHIGAANFVEKILTKQLERIADKNNARIIIMGDLAENATKTSVGGGVHEQKMSPIEQIDYAVEIFKPFRDIIDGAVIGNHEIRTYHHDGSDLMKKFCKDLDILDRYLCYQGVIKYAWNERSYDVAIWHGAGGGSGSALNKLLKHRQVVVADVYMMGHVHQIECTFRDLFVPDPRSNRMTRKKQAFVITGSTLDYENSYAEEKGLPPSTMGFPKVYLGGRTESANKTTKRLKEIRVEI